MKRRQFGVMAGSGLAMGALAPVAANAQSATPDPNLLKTTLTPYGAERAGNADGSIPAWTGGWTTAPVPPDTPVDAPSPYDGDAMLYKVDGTNLGQYDALLTPGLKTFITKFGFYLRVFPTHRPAAAPQYLYDNMAANVTRAKLNPAGGRLGFTGGYGGLPFPIIDTSDPQIAGAQLIWNHLTHWEGYQNDNNFSPAIVVASGVPTLTAAQFARFYYPFYDPNGSPDSYDGYYSKLHLLQQAPPDLVGQETLVWHSTNSEVKPDISWELLNGQGRVRKAPNEQFDTPEPQYNGITNIDENQSFYGSPQKFDWTYLAKKEMIVPYNNNALHTQPGQKICLPKYPDPALIRWEKHRVWVVEANLHPGERNVIPKRRLYIDEDTGQSILGEAYDAEGNMIRFYMNPLRTVPSVPMTNPAMVVIFNLATGDYVVNGNFNYPPHDSHVYERPQPMSAFDATQMAASASF